MKSSHFWLAMVGLSLSVSSTPAFTRYVDVNSTNPVSPYTSWATAATNIQDAIDPPDISPFVVVVWVTNGIYQTGGTSNNGSNRVTIPEGAMVQSVNGPAVTVIRGYQVPGTTNGASAVRGVFLSRGATLSGFTVTQGATANGSSYAGGIYCQSTSAIVTNCVVVNNASAAFAGGVYSGTLYNCVLSGNVANGDGGGSFASQLNHCLLLTNSASNGGGASSGNLTNCVLRGNIARTTGGGAYYALNLDGCTIVGNAAGVGGGGGEYGATLNNCIIYYNTATGGGITGTNAYNSSTGNHCCTIPLTFSGAGNLTNEPILADLSAGDFHLQPGSPCIDAGSNAYVFTGADLDGNPRIRGGLVDMGAYEFQALIHYVKLGNLTPVSPFTNWPAAATNIQDAIDAASAGDFIVVSNGVYNYGGRAVYGVMTNRVVVDKAVTVQSVNGPGATAIEGHPDNTPAAPIPGMRCAYLMNGAALVGFTLTNGGSLKTGDGINALSGGGVWCESASAIVSNCVITGNIASLNGGGAFQGALFNCILTNNNASHGGGACSNTLIQCTLTKNFASFQNLDSGGGAIYCVLSNCFLIANRCNGGGGGASLSALTSCVVSNNTGNSGGGVCLGVVNNSLISSNRAFNSGGGAYSNLLNNCVLKNNFVSANGGGAYYSTLLNCTVVSNTSPTTGGGIYGGALTNCIVYYNGSPKIPDYPNDARSTLNYCDAIPLATNGVGNITNEPVFVNLAGGDFHLQTNSPCINAGNNAWVIGTTDLDGNPRIIGGTVDLGAYESQLPALLDYFIWLQGYGLPTDAAVVYTDTDGDGMNNWQEWKAGTVPIDASSLLKMLAPTVTVSGVTVQWQSVSGKTYWLERSGDLSVPSSFSTLQSNIPGQAGATTYNDTTATGPGPFFYRVGVQ